MVSFERVRTLGSVASSPRAESARADVASSPSAGSPGRDLRIDLIRGLALWMIFVDHLTGNPLNRITFGHFALADALDIFIFLSGISCGILYGKLVLAGGLARAQPRALRRAVELYVANVFIGLVNVACFFPFRHLLDTSYIVENDLTLLDTEPLRAIAGMLGLFYTPQMMDILPLYMVLVLATPAVILLLTRSAVATLAVSAGLWLTVAVVPQLTIPSLGQTGAVSLNPLSWQFLFCIGLWLGKRHFVDGVAFRPRASLVALCWVIVVAGFVARHAGLFSGDPDAFAWAMDPAVTRTNIHPARLVNFLACAYLTASYLRADSPLLRSRWTAPLRMCGRHSLEVFCAGGVVSIAGSVAIEAYGPRLSLEMLVTLIGVALMTAVAWWLDERRARAQSPVVSREPRPTRVRVRG